jgi:3-deoxy-7-phosphoheptulonate synthase
VTPVEIHTLKNALRDVALGNSLLLQGGDCAELFSYCAAAPIDAKVKLLLQMSLVLIWGANKPVVRIARMAGQYAKPRSSPEETLPDGRRVASFRGDILNGYETDQRTLDPDRLVQAYFHSAATLNYVRAQLASGIADLHSPMDWGLGHVRDKELQAKYTRIVDSIRDSLRFMRTVGADTAGQLRTVDLFASHEGLVLDYEEALVRRLKKPVSVPSKRRPSRLRMPALNGTDGDHDDEDDSEAYGYYNTSAHFLWIGDRTRQIDGAHVEFFRGLENPIGIKVGPSMDPQELVRLLDVVNPRREIGKITLITRYGAEKIEGKLGSHIEAVKATDHTVIWQCDPMHG